MVTISELSLSVAANRTMSSVFSCSIRSTSCSLNSTDVPLIGAPLTGSDGAGGGESGGGALNGSPLIGAGSGGGEFVEISVWRAIDFWSYVNLADPMQNCPKRKKNSINSCHFIKVISRSK